MPQPSALSHRQDLQGRGHHGRGKGLGELTDARDLPRYGCAAAQSERSSRPDLRDAPAVKRARVDRLRPCAVDPEAMRLDL